MRQPRPAYGERHDPFMAKLPGSRGSGRRDRAGNAGRSPGIMVVRVDSSALAASWRFDRGWGFAKDALLPAAIRSVWNQTGGAALIAGRVDCGLCSTSTLRPLRRGPQLFRCSDGAPGKCSTIRTVLGGTPEKNRARSARVLRASQRFAAAIAAPRREIGQAAIDVARQFRRTCFYRRSGGCEFPLPFRIGAAHPARPGAQRPRHGAPDRPLGQIFCRWHSSGSPGRIRTSDQPVNSRLLYR